MQDYAGAIEDYNKAIKVDPNYADSYYNRGNAEHNLGDYYNAIESINQALKLDPSYASAYYVRGHVMLDLGKKNEARQDWKKGTALGNMASYEALQNELN